SGVTDSGYLPFYSGRKHHNLILANACAAHRLSQRVTIFEGAGYGANGVSWELAQSEGGGYVKNRYYSCRGLSLEVGAMVNIHRVALSASVSTIRTRQWYGSLGVCVNIGKLR
ncbi:MAG: hypothetical protein K2K92_00975, partial [Duncaniella sp.]|nr:hypothetical protein [Duncaniella sp.]